MSPYTRALIWANVIALIREQDFYSHVTGRWCIGWGAFAFHFWIQPDHRFWGLRRDWYDGRILHLGCGPWFALVWMECIAWSIAGGDE